MPASSFRTWRPLCCVAWPCRAGADLVVPNGVDADYFDPTASYATPFEGGSDQSSLPGQWTTARTSTRCSGLPVRYFRGSAALTAGPLRHRRFESDAGRLALAEMPGVLVTGRVPDVRPYLAYAGAVVAPLRLARGVQNKVLEAMSMARPVVATENAVQGIPGAHEGGVTITSDAGAMAEVVVRDCLQVPLRAAGSHFVRERYRLEVQCLARHGLVRTRRQWPCATGVTQSAVA